MRMRQSISVRVLETESHPPWGVAPQLFFPLLECSSLALQEFSPVVLGSTGVREVLSSMVLLKAYANPN